MYDFGQFLSEQQIRNWC